MVICLQSIAKAEELECHCVCCLGEEDANLFFDEDEVLGNLPPEQRAAYLAARAEQGLGLDDEVDEVRGEKGKLMVVGKGARQEKGKGAGGREVNGEDGGQGA